VPKYRIEIHTGSRSPGSFASTDANVYLTLLGTRATSDELVLESAGTRFGQDSLDEFTHQLADLGDITRIRVRHDNCGLGPGWFLEAITIRHEDTAQRWDFPCHRWLARHEDDGEIERTLDAA